MGQTPTWLTVDMDPQWREMLDRPSERQFGRFRRWITALLALGA